MKQLLTLFNLRPIERQLFEALFYGGQMSASQIAKQIGISRTSAYDLIERLIEIGLVTETPKAGVKMFNTVSPGKIDLLLKEKQDKLAGATNELEYLKQAYLQKVKTQKPRLQLYEGRAELQQMMKDMLLYRDMTVYAFWPVKKVLKLLTPEFIKRFHTERIERNVKLKVIWAQGQIPEFKQFPYLKASFELKREVRLAPKDVDFSLGYVIYGHTVRFLSSSKENFGFLVISQEMAEMMKKQFMVVWSASKSLKNK